jgi:hypothetical protein
VVSGGGPPRFNKSFAVSLFLTNLLQIICLMSGIGRQPKSIFGFIWKEYGGPIWSVGVSSSTKHRLKNGWRAKRATLEKRPRSYGPAGSKTILSAKPGKLKQPLI